MARGRLWRVLSEPYAAAKGLVREKETLFWVVVFPLIWLVLVSSIFGGASGVTIRLGVADDDGGAVAGALVEAAEASGVFEVTVGGLEDVLEGLRNGELDAALYIPQGFTDNITMGTTAWVKVYTTPGPEGNQTAAIVLAFLDSFAGGVSERAVEEAIGYIEDSPMPPEYKEYAVRYLHFIVDPLEARVEALAASEALLSPSGLKALYAFNMIGIEALFVGMFAGVLSIQERKARGSLRLILSTPISGVELLAADTLATLLLMAVSTAVILAAGAALGAEYAALNPQAAAAAAALVAAGILFTLGLGFILAPLARRPETAGALVNSIAFPVMFAGGLAVPKYILPEALRAFAEAWPLTAVIEQARLMVAQGKPAAAALADSAWAIAAALIVYAAGAAVYRRLLERAAEQP